MNGCEYHQELISRLIDGELSEEGRAVLAQHLRECGECAAIYDAFAGISQAIGDDMEEAPESLAENVMAHVRRSVMLEKNGDKAPERAKRHPAERKRSGNKAGVKVILSAAACLALVVAAAYTLPVFKGADGAQIFAAPKAMEPQTADIIGGADAATGMMVTNRAEAPEAIENEAAQAAPSEAAPMETALEDAAQEEAEPVYNIHKIEILYAGELVEDFTLRVGEAPVRLTGKIYPISVEESPRWKSSDESIISVTSNDDGSCIVEAVGAGSARVLAEYGGKTGECWVRAIADSTAPPADGLEIQYAGSKIYEFTMHVGDANIPLKGLVDTELLSGDISWSSTDDSVIRVHDTNDGWCAVEAVDEGGASVVLECDGMQVRCKVYVVEKPEEKN